MPDMESAGNYNDCPYLTVAILIAWRTRKLASELAHNLAVAFWISANSFWMISEFLGFDEKNSGVELRVNNFHSFPFYQGFHIALLLFSTTPQEIKLQKTTTM